MATPTLQEALALLRQVSPEHGEVLGRHLYTDTLVPSVGNKKAYQDFLTRKKDAGYHIMTDLNNFSEINKLHGNPVGDEAIKRFGELASQTSRKLGLKAHRIGGDEFSFHADTPEQAQAFAHELQRTLTKEPKVGGTHNLAAAIGVGVGKDQAEKSLIEAKKKLGTYDETTGKRKDFHSAGNAPSVTHLDYISNKAEIEPDPARPIALDNPLTKNMAIISASASNYPANKSLKQALDELKIPYTKLEEHFGDVKHSYLVGPVHEQLAKSLAEDSGQESLIYFNTPEDIQLFYVNGPFKGNFHKAKGINYLDKPQDNYYLLEKLEKPFNFWFDYAISSDTKLV